MLLNLAFYRFFRWPDFADHREHLTQFCRSNGLKGTLLLSPEGMNAMICGPEDAVQSLVAELERTVSPSGWLTLSSLKESWSETCPHQRMLVKLKHEIIPVGDPDVEPEKHMAPMLSPKELKEWLDQGKPVTLLDTRNTYEVEVGTFTNAQHWSLENSRDFVAQADAHHADIPSDRPVVMFCTGGIRCEKATAALLKRGWENIYQLDGGILRYFEECGGAHFDGNCFIFDWRLALDPELKPAPRDPEAGPSKSRRSFGRHQISESSL